MTAPTEPEAGPWSGVRALLVRWGFKPYLRSCPPGQHRWHAIYGDEILADLKHLSRWRCHNCPKWHPNPVADPPPADTGTWFDPWRRHGA